MFRLKPEEHSGIRRMLLSVFKKPLEKILDFNGLNKIYYKGLEVHKEDQHFSKSLLDAMNITVEVDEKSLERIPKSGKVVIVANHPFGGIEGVIMGSILREVRPDSKIMANYMLGMIPELRDLFLFVNPFETASAARENLKSMKGTIALLKDEGALGVFPAGTVSHMTWKNRNIVDPVWSDSITKIIMKTGAPVLPMYFSGQNPKSFQTAGLIHPMLRTMLLPRQFSNKENTTIKVSIGKCIPHVKLKNFSSESELTRYLRQRTYLLSSIAKEETEEIEKKSVSSVKKENYEKIIDPVPVEKLLEDINALPEKQLLLTNNEYEVYYSNYKQIPNVMREIGRLREFSFRATDEGTGKSIDIDSYDEHYMHLFIWQKDKQEIVGAYRLGRTDDILKRKGKQGLYTTTLFNIKDSLIKEISPALEMGRSFIQPNYQRSFAPLLLLWKGIGHYVVKHPRYKILYGPVSISNDYQTRSRNLMVTFLKLNNYLPDLAKLVKPKTPFKSDKNGWKPTDKSEALIDIDDVSDVVSFMEQDAKGVPILLKQYLKLGGKMLGFNVDPDFADALDGLILVDLSKTDPTLLSRYMGKEGMDEFRKHHGMDEAEKVA